MHVDMTLIHICDPLCENPAKVIFCDLLFSTKKSSYGKVYSVKFNIHVFNIDWVRSCQIWNYSQINDRNKLWCLFSHN